MLIFLREKQVNSHAYHWNCQQSAFLSFRLGYIVRLYVPSIICLFYLREEPTQFSFQMDTQTRKWEAMDLNFGKGLSSARVFQQRILFSFTSNMYVFLCESGADKSYGMTAKIANTQRPLKKIEFKSEKKTRVSKRQNFSSSTFFSLLYFSLHIRDIFTEKNLLVATIIGNSTI